MGKKKETRHSVMYKSATASCGKRAIQPQQLAAQASRRKLGVRRESDRRSRMESHFSKFGDCGDSAVSQTVVSTSSKAFLQTAAMGPGANSAQVFKCSNPSL